MKFILAVAALFLIGGAAAQQHPQQAFIDDLIKRGETLVQNAKLLTGSIRQQGRGHLVDSVEHEVIYVEALVLELKAHSQTVSGQNVHRLHMIEEELLHHENRISEELDIILNRAVPTIHANHTTAEVIARGNTVLRAAQEELQKLPANSREARSIQNEITQVQALLNTINLNPAAANANAVEQIFRHEQTLDILVKRAKAQQPPVMPAVPTNP